MRPPAETPKPREKAKLATKQTFAQFGVSRNTEGRRVPSGGAAWDDKKKPNQVFNVELCLASESTFDGSSEAFDHLLVRANTFPGYPGHKVLQFITSPAGKWLVAKGQVATWRVTPATSYHALVLRAQQEPLLLVDDQVGHRMARSKDALERAEAALGGAEDKCASLGAAVSGELAALVRSARHKEDEAPRTKAAKAKTVGGDVLGTTSRGKQKTDSGGRGAGGGREKENKHEPVSLPRFDKPAWESDRTTTSTSETLHGFDEKELASCILAAVQSLPGPAKVSPATATASDLLGALRLAQKQHSLHLGVPTRVRDQHETDEACIGSLPLLVLKVVKRCGFPGDFQQRSSTLAKATGGAPVPKKPTPTLTVCPYGAGNASRTQTRPSDDSDAIDLCGDDDDDSDDDVVVIDDDDDGTTFVTETRESGQRTQSATPFIRSRPTARSTPDDVDAAKKTAAASSAFFVNPAALDAALGGLRAAAETLITARFEFQSVRLATRAVVKRKRGNSLGPSEADGYHGGGGRGRGRGEFGTTDFNTGEGVGWKARVRGRWVLTSAVF